MQKSLDQKLARIHADPHGCRDFILADAKDADMALSIGAPGKSKAGDANFRSLQEFRDIIEAIVQQGLVDIMLMSAHTNEILTIQKRIFDNSPVTPAAPRRPGTIASRFPRSRRSTNGRLSPCSLW